VDEDHRDKFNFVLVGSFTLAFLLSLLYRPSHNYLDTDSLTVDQLDYRSFQQVENAGYSIEVSCQD
jgi:hypothetical protein